MGPVGSGSVTAPTVRCRLALAIRPERRAAGGSPRRVATSSLTVVMSQPVSKTERERCLTNGIYNSEWHIDLATGSTVTLNARIGQVKDIPHRGERAIIRAVRAAIRTRSGPVSGYNGAAPAHPAAADPPAHETGRHPRRPLAPCESVLRRSTHRRMQPIDPGTSRLIAKSWRAARASLCSGSSRVSAFSCSSVLHPIASSARGRRVPVYHASAPAARTGLVSDFPRSIHSPFLDSPFGA